MLYTKKITNKTQKNDQENFAHRFGDNCLTNHLVKFIQDKIKPKRVGVFKVNTGYQFFPEKYFVRVLELPLTYCVIHVKHIKAYCFNVVVNIKAIRFIRSPIVLYSPRPLTSGPRPSCSDNVHSISGNLKQIA